MVTHRPRLQVNPRILLGICLALGAAGVGAWVLTERSEMEQDDDERVEADSAVYLTPFGAPTRSIDGSLSSAVTSWKVENQTASDT